MGKCSIRKVLKNLSQINQLLLLWKKWCYASKSTAHVPTETSSGDVVTPLASSRWFKAFVYESAFSWVALARDKLRLPFIRSRRKYYLFINTLIKSYNIANKIRTKIRGGKFTSWHLNTRANCCSDLIYYATW